MKKHYTFSKNWMIALAVATATPCALAVDINDEAGLRAIANDLAGEYTLTADITVTGAWTPIGSNDAPFTGKINGNGHVIKNLSVQNRSTARMAFINSAQGAEITKLGLENVNIVGNEDVGGLLGKDKGGNVISECFVTGYISGRDHVGAILGGCTDEGPSTIENCYALAFVDNYACQGGGLVGTPVDLEILNSYFAGTVYADNNCIGGLAALIDGGSSFTVSNSFVAAPMIQKNNCTWGAMGRILGNDAGRAYVLENNYALAGTRIGTYGEFEIPESDDSESKEGADKTFAELTDPNFIANTLGWDPAVWTTAAGVLPRFAWQKEASDVDVVYKNYHEGTTTMAIGDVVYMGVGTLPGAVYTSSNEAVATVDEAGNVTGVANGKATITVSVAADATQKGLTKSFDVSVISVVYNITTAEELNAMRFDLEGDYTLEADIDLSSIENFEPIGSDSDPFTGTFNGNGHVIKNLSMTVGDRDGIGFFGTAENASIEKVGFENANVYWTSGGGANVGAIVGVARGVNISESYVINSQVRGRDHAGAFVGGSYNGGDGPTVIEDCYSNAIITTTEWQCAGIMGIMINGVINRCYFSGEVNTRTNTNGGGMVSLIDGDADDINSITNSLCVAANITASADGSGRILGNTGGRAVEMDNNYGYEGVPCSGSDNADDATVTGRQGESVSDMDVLDEEFYAEALGWDMEGTWKMLTDAYPVLAWQETPVQTSFVGLPESIMLIQDKGNFDASAVKMLGVPEEGFDVEEVDTKYLRIRAQISVQTWPATTTTTYVKFSSTVDDLLCEVKVPVTIVPAAEASIHLSTPEDVLSVNNNLGFDYILDNDIDMAGVEFNGIGSDAAPFTGIFDGNGHSIKNVNRTVSNLNKQGGLFNCTSGAKIRNLGMYNVSIANGGQDIAGLVGRAQNTQVDQCYVNGYVNGNDHVGGFFGNAINCAITNSYVEGSIITNNYQVGGISGVANGLEITNCYVAGEVRSNNTSWPCRAGGAIGMTEGPGCSVTGMGSMASISGGIIGHFLGTADGFDNSFVSFEKNVYSSDAEFTPGEGCDADNTSAYEWCSIVDDNGNDWATVPRCTAADARTEDQLTTWSTYSAMGWDNEIWSMPADGGYPVLTKVDASGVESIVAAEPEMVRVYGVNGGIVVDAEGEAMVAVYTVSGALVGQYTVYGNVTIEVPAALYIVTVKNAASVKTAKVTVR